MDKANKIFRISEIVAKLKFEELNKEDDLFLQNWLEESQDHRILFQKMQSNDELLRRMKLYNKVNSSEKLSNLLDAKKEIERQKQRKVFIRFFQYAATILIPVLAVIIFILPIDKEETVNIATVSNANIDKSKIVLITDDGEEIELSDINNLNVNLAGGYKLGSKDGSLVYEPTTEGLSKKTRYNTIYIPRGAEFSLILSDGSRVWLNSDTKLKYPVEFVGDDRKVYLDGEAFFDVTKNENKQFVVETEKANIKVYGTTFNVNAYNDEDEVVATLVTGSIGFSQINSKEEIKLSPNEQIILSNNHLIKRVVNTEEFASWINGRLVFKETKLQDILKRISRWYDINIIYTKDEAKDLTFTGEFIKYEEVEEILDIISTTQLVRFKFEENKIIVY